MYNEVKKRQKIQDIICNALFEQSGMNYVECRIRAVELMRLPSEYYFALTEVERVIIDNAFNEFNQTNL
jgi:hypothetical protein